MVRKSNSRNFLFCSDACNTCWVECAGILVSIHFPFLHPQFLLAEDVTLLLNIKLNYGKAIS